MIAVVTSRLHSSWHCAGHLSVMAFHEKAGPRQVDFALLCFAFPKFSLSFLTGGCAERPGAVKGAFCAA